MQTKKKNIIDICDGKHSCYNECAFTEGAVVTESHCIATHKVIQSDIIGFALGTFIGTHVIKGGEGHKLASTYPKIKLSIILKGLGSRRGAQLQQYNQLIGVEYIWNAQTDR